MKRLIVSSYIFGFLKKNIENIKAKVIRVEDFEKILKYGGMATTAFVIDEDVKLVGKAPMKRKLKNGSLNKRK